MPRRRQQVISCVHAPSQVLVGAVSCRETRMVYSTCLALSIPIFLFYLRTCMMAYQGQFYQQSFGTVMESPLSQQILS